MDELIRAAAARRCEEAATRRGYGRPRERRASQASGSPAVARTVGARLVLRAAGDGSGLLDFEGYASVTEQGYTMWDWLGPYTEVVSLGAFGQTLAAGPDVAFLLNHGGMTLARTRSGTLTLSEDQTGLLTRASLNPAMSTVRDIQIAMDRSDLDEMSFAFQITSGQWSPDYTEYRINAVDIDRGDVSIVNFGANPATSGQLRAQEIVASIDHLGLPDLLQVQRSAAARVDQVRRVGDTPQPAASGHSLSLARARYEASAR